MQQQRFAAAIPLLEQVVAAAPEHGKAHGCLGVCYGATERYDLALTHLQQAERLLGPNSSLSYNRGLAHRRRGEAEAARSAFAGAVSLDAGNQAASRALAELDGAPVPLPRNAALILECVNDPTRRQQVPLGETTSIGRGWSADVRVREKQAAPVEAVIVWRDGALRCYPGPGVDAVWVDDAPTRSALLQEGSELRVGTRIFRVGLAGEQGAGAPPADAAPPRRAGAVWAIAGLLTLLLIAGGYWAQRAGWIALPVPDRRAALPAATAAVPPAMPTMTVPGRGEMTYLEIVRAYLQRYDRVGLSPADSEIVAAYRGEPVDDQATYLRKIRARKRGLDTDDDRLDRAYAFVLMAIRRRQPGDVWARRLLDALTIELSTVPATAEASPATGADSFSNRTAPGYPRMGTLSEQASLSPG